MDQLVRRRAACKAAVTRAEKWLSENESLEGDVNVYKIKLENLESKFKKFCEIQDAIEEIAPDAETEENERDLMEDKNLNLVCKIKKIIRKLETKIDLHSTQVSTTSVGRVRLPVLNLPMFDGKYSEYSSYKDLFKSLIIDNDEVASKIEKFYYLKNSLSNEPLQLIEKLPVTEKNFDSALELLESRYNNKRQIVASHFNDLIQVPNFNKCNAAQLRTFTANAKSALNSLLNSGIEKSDLFEALIVHILKAKLDFNTKKALEEHDSKAELMSLTTFFEFLDERSTILENLFGQDSQVQKPAYKLQHSGAAQSAAKRVSLTTQQNVFPDGPFEETHFSPPLVIHNSTKDDQGASSIPTCSYCRIPGHKIYACGKFGALSVEQRQQHVKNHQMCFGCLGYKHLLANCRSSGSCSICKAKHHVLLHSSSPRPRKNVALNTISSTPNAFYASDSFNSFNENQNILTNGSNNDTMVTEHSSHPSHCSVSFDLSNLSALNLNASHVLLATANVLIYPVAGPPVTARVLLDSGSQNSFICASLIRKLKCTTFSHALHVSGILNNKGYVKSMANITFYSSLDPSQSFETSCAVVEQITQKLPQVQIEASCLPIPSNVIPILADPNFHQPGTIDMLLGADVYYSLIKPSMVRLGKDLPVLIDTHLGWIISGIVPPHLLRHINYHKESLSFHITADQENEDSKLAPLIERFWTQEECTTSSQESEENLLAEKIFKSTTEILTSGRFQVNLPLSSPEAYKQLGDSFVMAKRRFMSLEKRLLKNSHLRTEYRKVLLEYLELGHAKVVPLSLQDSLGNSNYFVPHLAVLKENSASTKTRVVFDFSARSSSNISLNDITLTGPKVQPELMDILLRFRNFKWALTADIQKMYRQIQLDPKFHSLQTVLWRDSPEHDFISMQLTTVSFGQRSAAYLACRVLNEIASLNPQSPKVQQALLVQTYVDDVLTGFDSLTDLVKTYQEMNNILNKYGFSLHKFCSNSEEFTKRYTSDLLTEKDITSADIPCKVLGIKWNPQTDTLQVSTPSMDVENALSKREMLSAIAQCFDPLGLVSPVLVQAKLIMQSLWLLKTTWDEKISDPELLKLWNTFVQNLYKLKEIQIPRYTLLHKPYRALEIHGFCDASLKCYGGCIYLRAIYHDGSASSQLICSKSRIAPLSKPMTVPKLELSAMVLLANLFNRVENSLKDQLVISSSLLWSDSQVALSWIKGHPSRWTVFVGNRVSQIQQLTKSATWRHIRSSLNPADLLSRGKPLIPPATNWFSGPNFLWQNSDDTEKHDSFSFVRNLPEERKKSLVTLTCSNNHWISFIDRFSSFQKLVRSMAYVLRFVNNTKLHVKNTQNLNPEELNKSLNFLIKQLQAYYFRSLLDSLSSNKRFVDKRIASLNPFIDGDGILRVGGRLSNASIPFHQRHPILLPSRCNFSSLLLKSEHTRLGHGGPQCTLFNLRLKYWPLDGLREIKRVIRKCLICHKLKAVTSEQIMSALPSKRVNPSRAFQHVGIDFAGPFNVKSSPLRKSPVYKSYLALFVCLATKAVHLELVSELSSEAFIATLKRFVSRRGLPSTIMSDNGTNFVGASRQFSELQDFFKKRPSPVHDYLLSLSIEWRFIPPRSPHWGGLWESSIKSAKSHMNRMFHNSTYTFEQFYTILTLIEAILNSRPLFPLSNDPDDLHPLSPSHFLIGAPLTALPEKDISLIPMNRIKFWQQCTFVQQSFWKRWTVDYLNQLQNRPKWMREQPPPQIGDMVFVKDEDSPPLKWPLARIIDVFAGNDGRIRTVQLKTSTGIYTRPIVKIVPLPRDDLPSNEGK